MSFQLHQVKLCRDYLTAFQFGRPSISKFTREQLEMLPFDFYLEIATREELEAVWDKLPSNFQQNKYLWNRLPCRTHWNTSNSNLHIDGPPPSRKTCRMCLFHKDE